MSQPAPWSHAARALGRTHESEAAAMADDSGTRPVVVAGVDGSPESIAALSWASRYAAATGGTVRAVLAWHYPAAAGVAPAGVAPAGVAPVGVAPDAVREETERQMRGELAQAVAKVYPDASAAGVESKLAYGHPAPVLIEESKDADLLVVGSRGHGAFTGMLTGSVSVHCVNHAECPVVVVRNR
jgi:nucleotide-binding universal stress UspA family protein